MEACRVVLLFLLCLREAQSMPADVQLQLTLNLDQNQLNLNMDQNQLNLNLDQNQQRMLELELDLGRQGIAPQITAGNVPASNATQLAVSGGCSDSDELQNQKDQLQKEKDQMQQQMQTEKDQLQREKDQLQREKDQLQREKDQLQNQL